MIHKRLLVSFLLSLSLPSQGVFAFWFGSSTAEASDFFNDRTPIPTCINKQSECLQFTQEKFNTFIQNINGTDTADAQVDVSKISSYLLFVKRKINTPDFLSLYLSSLALVHYRSTIQSYNDYMLMPDSTEVEREAKFQELVNLDKNLAILAAEYGAIEIGSTKVLEDKASKSNKDLQSMIVKIGTQVLRDYAVKVDTTRIPSLFCLT